MLFVFISSAAAAHHSKGPLLDELEFKEAAMVDVVRIIAELSNSNVVVTPYAKDVAVTVFLRDVHVKDAIETICRINNLWYRYDEDTNTYRIMTNEEYTQDLVIHRDEATKVFTLNNMNVSLAADAIANIYGSRVIRSNSGETFTVGKNSGGNTNNGSNNNSNQNNSNNSTSQNSGAASSTGTGTAATNKLEQDLSPDQLSALQTQGQGKNLISAAQVQQLFDQQEPIYVSVVSEHNLVLIRTGDEQALSQITELIDELDRSVPQVLLEMKILDVLVDDSFSSVFNIELDGVGAQGDSEKPILIGNNPLSNNGSFVFEYMNSYLKANIELLQRNKKVNVLSTPMVLASNNRSSKLFVGEELLITNGYTATASTSNVDGVTAIGGTSIVPNTEIKEVGNTIDITPFINKKDGVITLDIVQQSSSVRKGGGEVSLVTSEGMVKTLAIDTVNSAELEGTIIVKDNHTIAVGGLIRETMSDDSQQVPILGDLPILGHLFKSTNDVKQRSELILLITPRLLSSPEEGEFTKRNLNLAQEEISLEQLAFQCGQLCR